MNPPVIAPREVERGGREEAHGDAPLVPLSDLCVPRTGVRDPSSNPDEPFKYVDISAVDNRAKRITAPQTLMGKVAPSRARNVIRAGDVLVATTRPNLNAVAMVPGELDDQICSTGFCVLRAGPRIHPDYLFQFVQSPAFVQPLSDLVKGALYPAVNDSQVLALKIPLPPLAEQERIAGRLTEQLGAVERARAAAAQRLAAAESLPAALLREVFDGPQASGWETVRLGDAADIASGLTLGRRAGLRETRRVPYLRVANVKDGFLALDDVYEIEATNAEIEDLRLRRGDLLLTEGGDRDKLGRGTFWREELPLCLHQNHIFRVRLDDRFCHEFITLQIGSAYGKDYFLKHAKQTTGIATINQGVLRNFPLLTPDLPTQRRLAADLGEKLAAAEGVIARCREELAAIEALPASLLRDAFAPSSAPGDGEGA